MDPYADNAPKNENGGLAPLSKKQFLSYSCLMKGLLLPAPLFFTIRNQSDYSLLWNP